MADNDTPKRKRSSKDDTITELTHELRLCREECADLRERLRVETARADRMQDAMDAASRRR